MKYIALLTIAAYFSINALVSAKTEWFRFIYDMPGGDKIAHVVGAGLLAFIMVLGFSSLGKIHHPFGPIASLAAATLLVTLGEIIQIAMPSRDFGMNDLGWSFAGILVFGLAAIGIERIRYRRSQSPDTLR